MKLMKSTLAVLRKVLPWRFFGISTLAVLLYWAFGSLVLPGMIKSSLQDHFHEQAGLETKIAVLRINPFKLSLYVKNLKLQSPETGPIIGLDELYVNMQITSLFRWGFIFDEIRSSALVINLKITETGKSNLSNLFPKPGDIKCTGGDKKIIPVRIGTFTMERGRIFYHDMSEGRDRMLDLTPISFTVNNFTTEIKEVSSNRYVLRAQGRNGGAFHWSGDFQVAPFVSSGHMEISGMDINQFAGFYADRLPFKVKDGILSFTSDYSILKNPVAQFTLTDASWSIKNPVVSNIENDSTILELESLSVHDVSLSLGKKHLSIKNLNFNNGLLNLVRYEDRTLNLQRSFDPEAMTHLRKRLVQRISDLLSLPDTAETWSWEIQNLNSDSLTVVYNDLANPLPVNLNFHDVKAEIYGIGNIQDSSIIHLQIKNGDHGEISLEGAANDSPWVFNGELHTRGINLAQFQPYITPSVRIKMVSGELETNLNIQAIKDDSIGWKKVVLRGTGGMKDIRINDQIMYRKLATCASVKFQNVNADLLKNTLNVKNLHLYSPRGSWIINEEKKSNLKNLMVNKSGHRNTNGNRRWSTYLHRIHVWGGDFNISNLSLEPDFNTTFTGLAGTIQNVSSYSGPEMKLDLTAKIDRYAPVTLKGTANIHARPPLMNIYLKTDDMELNTFTPFSALHAGYKIKKGLVDLELSYSLANDYIKGDNHFNTVNMEFGDKVKSEQATRLPIKLWVALLSDQNDEIELDVNFEGNIKDPDFNVAGLFWKVLKNLILKAATSPFKLFASMMGGGDDLDKIPFSAGSGKLEPVADKKLKFLAMSIAKRPRLQLEIQGQVDFQKDLDILRKLAFKQAFASYSGITLEKVSLDSAVNQPLRTALFTFYTIKQQAAWETIRDSLARSRPDGDYDPMELEKQTARIVYNEMLHHYPLNPEELHTLAMKRAQRVKSTLIEKYTIETDRLYVMEADVSEGSKQSQVLITLKAR